MSWQVENVFKNLSTGIYSSAMNKLSFLSTQMNLMSFRLRAVSFIVNIHLLKDYPQNLQPLELSTEGGHVLSVIFLEGLGVVIVELF